MKRSKYGAVSSRESAGRTFGMVGTYGALKFLPNKEGTGLNRTSIIIAGPKADLLRKR